MTEENDQIPSYFNMPGGPIKVYSIVSCSKWINMYECINCGFRTDKPEWDDDGEDDFPVCPKCGHLMEFCGCKEVEQGNDTER